MDLTFLRPAALWLFPGALLVALLWRLRRRSFVAVTTVRWLRAADARASAVRRLPALLVIAAIGLITVASMDPVLPYSESDVQSIGLDLVLVLDLSSSMQETMGLERPPRTMAHLTFTNRDTLPLPRAGRTRLDTTKDALIDFISRRRDDRIGLLVFSDHPYVVSPLTFDYDALIHYVRQVDDQSLRGEGMTAIGDGVALANYLLARQSTDERRNKAVVVFTDGENNFGRDPIEALGESDAAGIRVHVIGVDLEEEIKRKPPVLRLIQTVRRHGGQYFNAETVQELRSASVAIDSLEKGRLTHKVYVRNAPVFGWFGLPALVLLAVAMALGVVPYFADLT
jgi:Ca-activated chloride channel family protein